MVDNQEKTDLTDTDRILLKCGKYVKTVKTWWTLAEKSSRTLKGPAEEPQLRLGNSDRTHVRHAFVPIRTFPGGVIGIHEVMR